MAVPLRPIITEKMTKQGEQLNRYAFKTNRKATKGQIKVAVQEAYDVEVVAVNTMVVPSKRRSRFTKSGVLAGRTQAFKKAVVTLKEGDVIDFYSEI